MNPEFWNIFPVSSRGFSGRIPVGIVPSPIGYLFRMCCVALNAHIQVSFRIRYLARYEFDHQIWNEFRSEIQPSEWWVFNNNIQYYLFKLFYFFKLNFPSCFITIHIHQACANLVTSDAKFYKIQWKLNLIILIFV